MKKLISLVALWVCASAGDSQAPAFRMQEIRKLGEYPPAPARALGQAWDRSGALWFYSLEDLKTHFPRLYRLALGAAEATEIRFDLTGAGVPSGFQIVPNLFADGEGGVFFPVLWRDTEFRAAIVRVSADGRTSTVRLTPPVEARHLVVRGDGSFVVLGTDAEFFFRRETHCHLLHLYGSDGQRRSSFSACPDYGLAGSSPTRRDGIDYRLLKEDVDHGQLWLEGDSLFHLLPASREIRSFSLPQLAARVVRLQAPPTQARRWIVRRLFPLTNAYLVYWMGRTPVSPNAEAGEVVAVLHNRDGGFLSRPVPAGQLGPLRPVAVTESGELICWEPGAANGKGAVWISRVALRQ